MKKIITLLFAVTLLLINNCFSQDNATTAKSADTGSKDKGYIGFGLGANVPLSEYAGKKPTLVNGVGYAKFGGSFEVSFGRKLFKSIGVAGLFRGIVNPIDKQALQTNNFNKAATVEAKSWNVEDLLVGFYGSFTITPKASFESRAMLGLVSAKFPQITTTYQTEKYVESASRANAFGYLIGVGLKVNMNEKMCFLANLDYSGAKLGFGNIPQTYTNGSYTTTGSYTANLKYGAVNIGVGIGFRM